MKQRFRDAEHLVRLAAVFVAALLVFLAVRAALVPDDFGLLGHYRASALEMNRQRSPSFAGQAVCVECHSDVAERRAAEGHRGVACEGCHGAAVAHANAPADHKPARPDGRTLCVRCHAANTGKPRWYRTVVVQDHAGDQRCIDCHPPHDPRMK